MIRGCPSVGPLDTAFFSPLPPDRPSLSFVVVKFDEIGVSSRGIVVLQSRPLYYTIDLGTTESSVASGGAPIQAVRPTGVVNRNRSWYYRVEPSAIESILVLQSRLWYYTSDVCTTGSIPVL